MPAWDEDWDDEQNANDPGDDGGTCPCPACGEPVYDDSPRCPSCGEYLADEGAAPARPTWVVVTALVCLALAAWWVIAG